MSKTKLSLLSILEAIEKIERYTSTYKSADEFYHDERDFDATMISKLDDNFKIGTLAKN